VHDIETIDSELRLVARAWRVARHMGCTPSTAHMDELLDERSELTGSRSLIEPNYLAAVGDQKATGPTLAEPRASLEKALGEPVNHTADSRPGSRLP
jgi:hypothetical protein